MLGDDLAPSVLIFAVIKVAPLSLMTVMAYQSRQFENSYHLRGLAGIPQSPAESSSNESAHEVKLWTMITN